MLAYIVDNKKPVDREDQLTARSCVSIL